MHIQHSMLILSFNEPFNGQCIFNIYQTIQCSMGDTRFQHSWVRGQSSWEQWCIFSHFPCSMHIQCSTNHSMFNKPFNVQWAIRCSRHIQFSINHSMIYKPFNVQWVIQGFNTPGNNGAFSFISLRGTSYVAKVFECTSFCSTCHYGRKYSLVVWSFKWNIPASFLHVVLWKF